MIIIIIDELEFKLILKIPLRKKSRISKPREISSFDSLVFYKKLPLRNNFGKASTSK